MSNKIIRDISRLIENNQLAVFCGAGISYNSGLPLVYDLEKEILKSLDVPNNEFPVLLNSNIPFEYFIETIRNEIDVDKILEIFSCGMSNTNHYFLAELVKQGKLKTIVTTNFDLLIEKALLSKGLIKNIDFNVYYTQADFDKVDFTDQKVRLIKIHGCASEKSEMAITLNQIGNKTQVVSRNNLIRNFFSKSINPNILILGYSCSDVFDISPQIEEMNKNKSKIYFVQHIKESEIIKSEHVQNETFKNPFKTFDGIRLSINMDDFIRTLHENLIEEPYKFTFTEINWKKNISDWIAEAISENTAIVKFFLPNRLYYNIAEYEYALKYASMSLKMAKDRQNQRVYLSELGNLGVIQNALGNYPEARLCLEHSIKGCQATGNTQGEYAQLQSLGNVYRNIAEYTKAEEAYKRAVKLSIENDDKFSLANSYGNLSSVYVQTKQPKLAIDCLTKGIEIARQIGNKQAEGSMLCSIGSSLVQMGLIQEGKNYIVESVKLTGLLGDKQGESMALLNLSNIGLAINDFDFCIKYAERSLTIALEIGIKQSQGNAYYNIGTAYFYKSDLETAMTNYKSALFIFREVLGEEHRLTQSTLKGIKLTQNRLGK